MVNLRHKHSKGCLAESEKVSQKYGKLYLNEVIELFMPSFRVNILTIGHEINDKIDFINYEEYNRQYS